MPMSFKAAITLDVQARFGASGDGVTDDSQSFVDAIAVARSVGYPIYVPPGNYRLATFTAQNVGSNRLVIHGADARLATLDMGQQPQQPEYTPGETFLNFGADSELVVKELGFTNFSNVLHAQGNIGQEAIKEVTIDSCHFEQCNHAILANQATSGTSAFLVDEWERLRIANCSFRDMFQGACYCQVGTARVGSDHRQLSRWNPRHRPGSVESIGIVWGRGHRTGTPHSNGA